MTTAVAVVTTIHGHDKDRQPPLSQRLPYACRTHPIGLLSQPTGHIPSSRCQISASHPLNASMVAKLLDPDDPRPHCFSSRGGWWSWTGSNRRPHACKARALPTELCPRRCQLQSVMAWCTHPIVVGLGRLERPTSPLSGVRSNHLSYRPVAGRRRARSRRCRDRHPSDPLVRMRKRNEDGASRQMGPDWTLYLNDPRWMAQVNRGAACADPCPKRNP